MSSRPNKMPELLNFHLNPDECFLTDVMNDKMRCFFYADASAKSRVKFRVWQINGKSTKDLAQVYKNTTPKEIISRGDPFLKDLLRKDK